jgi:hypothetical protein
MSLATAVGPVRVTDYETVDGKPISANSGPKCYKCGKPFKQCSCPPVIEVPGENTTLESPATRQATSSEVAAFQAGKIEKHLASIAANLEKLVASLITPHATSHPLGVGEEEALPAVAIAIPGVTESGVPTIDPAVLAANEAKKAEVLEKTRRMK